VSGEETEAEDVAGANLALSSQYIHQTSVLDLLVLALIRRAHLDLVGLTQLPISVKPLLLRGDPPSLGAEHPSPILPQRPTCSTARPEPLGPSPRASPSTARSLRALLTPAPGLETCAPHLWPSWLHEGKEAYVEVMRMFGWKRMIEGARAGCWPTRDVL